MLASLSFIFIFGLAIAALFQRLKLPRIIGMLILGIILGPYVLHLLNSSILGISADLREIALIIILIKAGLSLDIQDLKKVGRPALLMSFIPALFEIIAFVCFAPLFLGVNRLEAAIIWAILGAVSPAVVVPKMVYLIESRLGTNKSIPQLILAGASLDDVFVIVLFTSFIGMEQGGSVSVFDFLNIPISIIFGVALGAFTGILLAKFFENSFLRRHTIRNSIKVIIILGMSFLLVSAETWLEEIISLSGLLAVISMACALKIKSNNLVSKRLSEKFGKLWLAAEVILFVLVGAAVDIGYTLSSGFAAVAMIFIGLLFRSIGVMLCMIHTPLNLKERIFCVISYLPKATVQAAIGAVPLSLGLPCGQTALSVAVLSIIISASLGAFGIDASCKKLLSKE